MAGNLLLRVAYAVKQIHGGLTDIYDPKVHTHQEHIKFLFLLPAETSGFGKYFPTRIGECNYKLLNLSGVLDNVVV